ncbi:CorA family divalent cation transporter [Campylobacter sp. 19-13652]|uniref:CorA family divalent cation transporter n=1 Tax=Campylobacter sp. 19-13652 TaxID=2840180 RepID=UPI001C772860|nr:CorA family divalent cation transporter [Campylobacter sp. 19-13652]BCX79453.1 magnesium transporter CorA [Campylobacter sp. 19-13652]
MQKEAKHLRSGYFYDGEHSYLYLISKEKHLGVHKFIFRDSKIYEGETDNDGEIEVSQKRVVEVVRNFIQDYHQRVLKYATTLDKYEKIYTHRKDYTKFMQKHSVLKYELRRFQSRISSIYDALMACITDQPNLKKELKSYASEAAIYKAAAAEYASRIDDIYQYIQSIKNDKINANIYLLTVLSAIFLPLNLITGFFGMNTTGLYLGELKNGTNIVSALILGVVVLFVLSWKYYDKKSKS